MALPPSPATEQILGIPFFCGTAQEAVAQISQGGGLLVAPSGTCFERFVQDEEYRRAILTADLTLPDSGAMVALWRTLAGRQIPRISGLAYLKALLETVDLRDVLWVLPHERAQAQLIAWSERAVALHSAFRTSQSAISSPRLPQFPPFPVISRQCTAPMSPMKRLSP